MNLQTQELSVFRSAQSHSKRKIVTVARKKCAPHSEPHSEWVCAVCKQEPAAGEKGPNISKQWEKITDGFDLSPLAFVFSPSDCLHLPNSQAFWACARSLPETVPSVRAGSCRLWTLLLKHQEVLLDRGHRFTRAQSLYKRLLLRKTHMVALTVSNSSSWG